MQDTFPNAYRAWHQYLDGSESVGRGCCLTICRNQFPHQAPRRACAGDGADPESRALAAAALHTSVKGVEPATHVRAHRGDRSDRVGDRRAPLLPYREVALMVDVHDQTYDTVSQILGVRSGRSRSCPFARAAFFAGEAHHSRARDAGLGAARGTRGELNHESFHLMPMINCDEVMRQLWDYTDGELTPSACRRSRRT
ncbi:MAG: hypothetical protein IPG88_20655 [Gemmatimonadetes bacterium]|nr:hypothetical protein [Gemmatimonadota bacterium]